MTIVGIDLGTTNSLVAVMGDDGPRCLANELGDELTPSALAIADDGAVLVGRAARDRLVVAPDSGRAFFKRDMGTPATYRFGGRTWTPPECSAHVLRELKRVAELRLGVVIERAVVTVPAYFHDSQRQATLTAAQIAGLKVERILNEPTAAALAYGARHRDRAGKLLIFDLGGGTFDVTVLEVFDGVIEIKASGGESRLGGEDYTDALLDHLLRARNLKPSDHQRARLRPLVEVAKRRLAGEERVEFALAGQTVAVSRGDFAAATAGLTARLRPVLRRCLRDAGMDPKDIDDVLLVGGASRMPMVGEAIAADFARPGDRSFDPDRVVALGAAVQAALCGRDAAVQDLVLTDVCPHTLGVEVAKQFAPGHQQAGFFSPIIDRNTTVPVSRVDRYNTMQPEQDHIELKIFQGESRLTAENTRLGTMTVKGLRTRPGQKHPGEVDVRFSYDMNGILEVDVTVLHSNEHHRTVIESRPGALTAEQIAEAVRRLQPLKIHPRDSLPNRARLERASRLFTELIGGARAALTAHVDAFEAALESQAPQDIAAHGAALDSFLAHFYQDEGERQPGPRGDGGGGGSNDDEAG